MTRTLFHGGTVFDGTMAPIAEADVVIEDGRIVDVGSGLDGDEQVDCSGRTVLPGLFDTHTHVMFSTLDWVEELVTPFSFKFYDAMRNLEATLATGITTVRDAAGADAGVKKAVEDGVIAGPRMRISVSMLSQTGGHADGWLRSGIDLDVAWPGAPSGRVDGPDAVRRKVREMIRAGADVIKVATSGGVLSPTDDPRHPHFRPDELEEMVAEATAAGIFVMAHAQGAEGIKNAVRAGIRSIEHGIYLDDEGIALMLERGTWLVPTLVAPLGVLDAVDAGASLPASTVEKAKAVIDIHQENVRRAIGAGVKVAMGTDSGVAPHGSNLRELDRLVRCGMSPQQALVATTSSAADLMGLGDELGTLAPGKRADLVLLDGDALEAATLRERVRRVWKDGVLVVDDGKVLR
ncbi:MAG TPA: amidohydrolase family protein [Actinomycetota bacterium]|nr:amidohydrolase family protein [Actinomycetota bacterium]